MQLSLSRNWKRAAYRSDDILIIMEEDARSVIAERQNS